MEENAYARKIPKPCTIVLFGVTGHLSRNKILPAFYDLFHRGLMPAGFALLGFARREWTEEEFASWAEEEIKKNCRTKFDEGVFSLLRPHFYFAKGTFDNEESFLGLKKIIGRAGEEQGTGGRTLFYLSIPPANFPMVIEKLKGAGLAESENPMKKVMVEKPFGRDLKSARNLDSLLKSAFLPSQIFRVDHYLGKEMVQNLLPLRFENSLFEPLWCSQNVDHVQISVAESAGVEGRSPYYEQAGAARDVLQNHLMQLLALTAMEKPEGEMGKRERKIEALKSCKIENLARTSARGQYTSGFEGGEWVEGYRQEEGISPSSLTDTYAALKVNVGLPRWEGTPFYLRTGKRLNKRSAEIALVLKRAPGSCGQTGGCIAFKIQPDEGVEVEIASKAPGSGLMRKVSMGFEYEKEFAEKSPEAYEELILDAMLEKTEFFPSEEETEISWQIVDELEGFWKKAPSTLEFYKAGSRGPACAERLMERDGRKWRKL